MSNTILKKNVLKSSFVVASSVGLVLSFQNCGKAGFDSSGGLNGTSLSSSAVGSVGSESLTSKGAPFMYDATFDTISYNSCSLAGSSGASGGNYTIKAGAYETGGLAVIPKAIQYSADPNNVKPEYPNNFVTYDQSKSFLSNSSSNKGMRLQSTFRDFDVSAGYPLSDNFTDGREVKGVLGDLSTDFFLGPLFKKAQTASSTPGSNYAPTDRFFGLAGYGERKMEVSLSLIPPSGDLEYSAFDWIESRFESSTGIRSMLSLSFKGPSDQFYQVHQAHNGVDKNGKPVGELSYRGRGYLLSFQQKQYLPYAGKVALESVQEIDLATGDAPSAESGYNGWQCLAEDQLIIVRQEDAATFCPVEDMSEPLTGYDSVASQTIRMRKLDFFRRHVPATWRINIAKGCVVPPASVSCYRNNPVANPFDPNFTAYLSNNSVNVSKIPLPISYRPDGLHIYQNNLPPGADAYAQTCVHYGKPGVPASVSNSTLVQCAHVISFCRRK